MSDPVDALLQDLKELGVEVFRCAGNNNAEYHRQWAERIKVIHNKLVDLHAPTLDAVLPPPPPAPFRVISEHAPGFSRRKD